MKLYGFKNFDELLAFNCAPVFAGIKAANLVSLHPQNDGEVRALVKQYNEHFQGKGLVFRAFPTASRHWLLLIYRPDKLQKILLEYGYQAYLTANGYAHPDNLEFCLDTLAEHLQSRKIFPHEIGVFLGYPLEDVLGFALNEGRNCKYCGYWKVYGDVEKARNLFADYERCRNFILNKLAAGMSLNSACATY